MWKNNMIKIKICIFIVVCLENFAAFFIWFVFDRFMWFS
jgi:hypothetical protein